MSNGDLNRRPIKRQVQTKNIQGVFNPKRTSRPGAHLPTCLPWTAFGIMSSSAGLFFYGPPGTGKTRLAKATAAELGVRDLFRQAEKAAPAVIFLDEAEPFVPRRESLGNSPVTPRVVTQFLSELDRFEEQEADVLVLSVSNKQALVNRWRFFKTGEN
ncbi:AAA family ATPase [Candidatus Bipolaricaulota bacterium]|nr:AAA family ATPase [Candidatus Bipolaricaulota bacterium]